MLLDEWEKQRMGRMPRGLDFVRSGLLAMIAALLSATLPGLGLAQTAQDRQIAFGKDIYKAKATCLFCHRWDGNGENGYGGMALSLRGTQLTPEQIAETIKCGRPGTGMPYHDAFAYTDQRCYGMTGAEMGTMMPMSSVQSLNQREVDAVVAYLEAKVVGRGPATYDDCVEFFDATTKQCDPFKK
jgi:mono/diheme cytochrome c family protein